MVKIKFKSKDDKGIEYYYQPEKEGEFGVVAMDFETMTIMVIERAEGDSEGSKFYTPHCAAMMRRYIKANDYKQEETEIWY